MNPIPYNRFTFSKINGVSRFVAEASDFNDDPHIIEQRVFDDACDVGFAIQGKERIVSFCQDDTKRDADGEVMVWIYRPITKHGRIDHAMNVEVHILND